MPIPTYPPDLLHFFSLRSDPFARGDLRRTLIILQSDTPHLRRMSPSTRRFPRRLSSTSPAGITTSSRTRPSSARSRAPALLASRSSAARPRHPRRLQLPRRQRRRPRTMTRTLICSARTTRRTRRRRRSRRSASPSTTRRRRTSRRLSPRYAPRALPAPPIARARDP